MSIAVATESDWKRARAFAAADGYLVTSRPWDVRWLRCGRGRPVDTSDAASTYTVVLDGERASVLYPDIEHPRVQAEERLDELGYDLVPYPWHACLEEEIGRCSFPQPMNNAIWQECI